MLDLGGCSRAGLGATPAAAACGGGRAVVSVSAVVNETHRALSYVFRALGFVFTPAGFIALVIAYVADEPKALGFAAGFLPVGAGFLIAGAHFRNSVAAARALHDEILATGLRIDGVLTALHPTGTRINSRWVMRAEWTATIGGTSIVVAEHTRDQRTVGQRGVIAYDPLDPSRAVLERAA